VKVRTNGTRDVPEPDGVQALADRLRACTLYDSQTRTDLMLDAADAIEELVAENANLARWKAEALAVLTEWDACYDILEAAGRGALVGSSKPRHVLDYIQEHLP
jgi:hypothetical protein